MEREHKRHLLKELVFGLYAEGGTEPASARRRVTSLQTSEELWNEFRALVNTRPPIPAGDGWLALQDELLEGLISETGIASIDDARTSSVDPRMRLWRGDITTLAADAIVNAANSQMLGCWIPGHHCIDNAIHTFAGVQLRLECARIMAEQGHEEPTGQAKLTGAYNLPAARVIHTVGPIANGHPSDLQRRQLASCYRSCLDLAAGHGLRSIALCCISTGEFAFPQQGAAEIAVQTVQAWLDRHGAEMAVVFNVFTDVDETAYRKLLT
ncbi:Appr-1-p processing domain protein [Olsenella uli DSM 7084]|uniref:Protein-ADP-ribose hydrolase n=1 Tax=Olsenella uli (strain ATCC 49627 / DSM 7084 / CCUG 31166 / CIP 109912 / JCM 12494 / LMG 11480 / NCIMB 702895 / VPI D76D-27C) TaxID=633147 RepID=E1QYB4_OLSUV|nr:protein-ADP-ribose hydrolase [Olsenella uli]ADK67378.1 Appr-1-p processing domain protein [Olsenella uli DSM 7084]KRO11976.1 Appr-1-p processing protein [Olsenella uli DSM 7084]